MLNGGFIFVIVFAAVLVIAGAYVGICMARVAKMPDMHPNKFVSLLRRHQSWATQMEKKGRDVSSIPAEEVKHPHPNPTNKPVLVVVGDSHTQCTYSADWFSSMSDKVKEKVFVINAGINGEMTDQIASRLDNIILCNPKYVFIMAGSNDRLCSHCSCSACAYAQCTRPRSLESYKEDYSLLLRRLMLYTTAYVSVLAVPPLEAPATDHINESCTEITNAHAREVVALLQERYPRRIEYLPVDERFQQYIRHGDGEDYFTPPSRVRWTPHSFVGNVMRAQFLHWVCGMSYDAVSARYGLRFTVDAIHLNSEGGRVLEEAVVEAFDRMYGRVDNEGNLHGADDVVVEMADGDKDKNGEFLTQAETDAKAETKADAGAGTTATAEVCIEPEVDAGSDAEAASDQAQLTSDTEAAAGAGDETIRSSSQVSAES